MTRYILLRDQNGAWRREPRGLTSRIDTPPDPVLEITELGPNDLRLVSRDPDVLGYAPSMPTRLVAPIPLDDPRPEEAVPGWGIEALGEMPERSAQRVALLDTGINSKHDAFDGVRIEGRDFLGAGLSDVNGHGTHLAGTVLGKPVEKTRIGILRDQPDLLSAKVLNDNGIGLTEDFLDGLIWAVKQGSRLIGFALGLDPDRMAEIHMQTGQPESLARPTAHRAEEENLALFETLLRMLNRQTEEQGGLLVLAAAGNNSRRMIAPDFEVACGGLAASPQVLSVGAVQPSEVALRIAPFSNTSPDLVAPGVGIVSAAPDAGLRALNGTSMAMAHALAVSALWLDQHRSVKDARRAILRGATLNALDPGAQPFDFGAGLIQAPKPDRPSLGASRLRYL